MDASDPSTPDAVRLGDFSSQADAYARSRPGYPPDLIRQLAQIARVHPGDAVADLGAGTGIFTRLLAAMRYQVIAIEPNPLMQQQAGDIPGVTWKQASFENTTLPDASVHWVTAAQAFHWAKLPDALHEMARILQPGGWLTLLWNRRLHESNPVTQWTIEAIYRRVPDYREPHHDIDWIAPLTSTGDFDDVQYCQQTHWVPMSIERYLDLWRSHNHLAVTAGPQRLASFIKELSAYLRDNHVQHIDVPYLCQAWSARRK